jgi:hypothetical protein
MSLCFFYPPPVLPSSSGLENDRVTAKLLKIVKVILLLLPEHHKEANELAASWVSMPLKMRMRIRQLSEMAGQDKVDAALAIAREVKAALSEQGELGLDG